jgi:hypothetical protein
MKMRVLPILPSDCAFDRYSRINRVHRARSNENQAYFLPIGQHYLHGVDFSLKENG